MEKINKEFMNEVCGSYSVFDIFEKDDKYFVKLNNKKLIDKAKKIYKNMNTSLLEGEELDTSFDVDSLRDQIIKYFQKIERFGIRVLQKR